MSLVATFDISPSGGVGGGRDGRGTGIRHSIYIGGKVDAKDREKLTDRWKVTHILNVTPAREANITAGVPNYFETKQKQQHQQPGHNHHRSSSSSSTFVYLRVPIYDSATSVSILEDAEHQIVNFIARGLCHGNVLVHCQHGISRSTTCVALYLMSKRGMTLDDALALIRRRRPQARPIPAFFEYLKRRDKELFRAEGRRTGDIDGTDIIGGNGDGNGDDARYDGRGVGVMAVPTTTTTRKRPAPEVAGPAKAAVVVLGPSRPPPPPSSSMQQPKTGGNGTDPKKARVSVIIGPSRCRPPPPASAGDSVPRAGSGTDVDAAAPSSVKGSQQRQLPQLLPPPPTPTAATTSDAAMEGNASSAAADGNNGGGDDNERAV